MAKRPATIPSFKSGFVLLDVTTGRKALSKYVAQHGKVRATVDVLIEYQWGSDDGTSTEFACETKALRNVRKA